MTLKDCDECLVKAELAWYKQKIEDLDRNLEKCEIKKLVPFPCGCRFTKSFYEKVCSSNGICENIISSEMDGKEGYYLRVHDQNKCLICIEREAKHDQ